VFGTCTFLATLFEVTMGGMNNLKCGNTD